VKAAPPPGAVLKGAAAAGRIGCPKGCGQIKFGFSSYHKNCMETGLIWDIQLREDSTKIVA